MKLAKGRAASSLSTLSSRVRSWKQRGDGVYNVLCFKKNPRNTGLIGVHEIRPHGNRSNLNYLRMQGEYLSTEMEDWSTTAKFLRSWFAMLGANKDNI